MAKQSEKDHFGRPVTIPEEYATNEALIEYLMSFISENKNILFDKVLAQRTKHLTVVFENIHKAQNASAVIRSCDCFGLQDVHFIEEKYKYEVNDDIVKGSINWVDIYKHNSTTEAFQYLKQQGYKLAATTPHGDCVAIDDLPVNEKVAILFGTELSGLTEQAIQQADYRVKIPMYGFTESFNLSASAAVILHVLTQKIRHTPNIAWQLSQKEKNMIKLTWIYRMVRAADQIALKFLNEKISNSQLN
jgi:tRNA (guanosine-2'-O-)-methyltransferase